MKILAITQARVGSSRLPGKILKKIGNQTLLEIHLRRILKSKRISKLKLATTEEDQVGRIIDIARICQVDYYQGSLNNVLDRFYYTSIQEKPDWVVRLTSDCPLIDAELIDELIDFALANDLDYTSNCLEDAFPDGQDVEVFKFSALEVAWEKATSNVDKEHVTSYIYNNSTVKGGGVFNSMYFPSERGYSCVRMTVDEAPDFEVIKALVNNLGTEASWREYSSEYLNTDIHKINQGIIRNEGFIKSLRKEDNE